MVNDPEFRVYPNPTVGMLTLELPALSGQAATIEITDLTGRRIMTQVLRQAPQSQLDLGGLKAGIYILSVYATDGVRTRRVVVR